jgi:hypothetical protein
MQQTDTIVRFSPGHSTTFSSSPTVVTALVHLRLGRALRPVPMLSSSRRRQPTQLLSALRPRSVRTGIRVLGRGHHMAAIQPRLCRTLLLLSVMLWLVMLLTVSRGRRVVLRRRRHLLMLVLRTRGRAQRDLRRRRLLVVLVLCRGRNRERSRRGGVGGLWRPRASAARAGGPPTPPFLAGASALLVLTLVLVFFRGGGRTADGQPAWDVVGTRARHAHRA